MGLSNVIEFQSRVRRNYNNILYLYGWLYIHPPPPHTRTHYNTHSSVMILHLEGSKRQTNHALLTIETFVHW